MVSLNASSSILGSRHFKMGLDSSRQGLVFTYISQGCPLMSIMKSYPKISKLNFLASLFSFLIVALREWVMKDCILSVKSVKERLCSCIVALSYLKDIWLPSASFP